MIVAGEVTVQLEKAVLKSSFSRLGGLQLDREVNWLNKHKQKKQKDKIKIRNKLCPNRLEVREAFL